MSIPLGQQAGYPPRSFEADIRTVVGVEERNAPYYRRGTLASFRGEIGMARRKRREDGSSDSC